MKVRRRKLLFLHSLTLGHSDTTIRYTTPFQLEYVYLMFFDQYIVTETHKKKGLII